MRYLLLFVLTILFSNIQSQENPKWSRYQSISPDGATIIFTYKGDLYKVASSGGNAQQLTFHTAHDFMAIWSPDGQQVAFASDRYGNFDIFRMSIDGGLATRLTFHSVDEKPYSFTRNGMNILFGAVRQDTKQHRQYPTSLQPELYSVSTNGGRVDQVFTLPAEYVQVSPDGNSIAYHDKKGYESEWRKHHTSSITRDLWIYNKINNSHKMITDHNAEDRQPIFSEDGQSISFLSEREGSFNVYKMNLSDTKNIEKLTNFSLHPVRFLSQGSGTLCFGYDGETYTMTGNGQPQKIAINIKTQDKNNIDKFISLGSGIEEMAISPNGKEIAFISRGEVFVTSVDKSFTKRITTTPERERFVTFSHDGESVIYSREKEGKWSIYQTKKTRNEEPFFFVATLLKEEVLVQSQNDNYIAEMSPDGKKIAYIEGRRSLKVMDLKSKNMITLLTPEELFHMRDGDKYFKWSPDSKWLLVDWGKSLSNSDVLLMAADGSKRVNLNESGYYDHSPKWVNDGKQMLWFSNRNGLKSYATSGRSQSDVYTMFFDQEAWDKYNLEEEDYKLIKQLKEAKEDQDKKENDKKNGEKNKKEDDEDKIKPLEFDWNRMKDRKTRLTIHSSRLGDAVLSKDGETLYYLARFEGKMNLWSTNLRTKETKLTLKLGAKSGGLEWDRKMENLYLLSDGKISKLDVDKGKKKSVKIKSEVPFDKNAERIAMFEHVWIRTKNIFYHSNFHGIDWNQMKVEYSKYLPYIGNSYEFAELLSEMLGEIECVSCRCKIQ